MIPAFNSTLNMKAKVTGVWKSINSKIHPPLPLSARDSQQLLVLLNTSFKQQLDRQHLAASSSNEDHASRHLQSILTNPLFDAKPRMSDITASKSQRIGRSLGQLQSLVTQPMDAFTQMVAQGTADLKMAKLCLSLQYRACIKLSAATPREAMQTSGTASTILQWLWSSGLEDDGIFLHDLKFVRLLVPFLVADCQHSRISHWLQQFPRQVGRRSLSLNELDAHHALFFLFQRLIIEEERIGDGLESAINVFHRTVANLQSGGHADNFIWHYVHQAAWTLTRCILRIPRSAEPQPPIFHAFSKTTRKLSPDGLLNAMCSVYIQKTPDPLPALQWFQTVFDGSTEIKSTSQRPHIIRLGLRAAELFLQDGSQAKALWIMNFLQTNFVLELGSPRPQVRDIHPSGLEKRLGEEETSLRLLDALTVH